MPRKRNAGKKSQTEAHRYRDFIEKSPYSPEGTTNQTSTLLVGTDETNISQTNIPADEKTIKTPIKYRIWDWIRKHLFAEIITAVVIGVCSVTINHMVKIAVIEQRIEYIEERLNKIENKSVDKDYLLTQIDLLKTEMESDEKLSNKDTEIALRQIEERLDLLEGND